MAAVRVSGEHVTSPSWHAAAVHARNGRLIETGNQIYNVYLALLSGGEVSFKDFLLIILENLNKKLLTTCQLRR